MKYSITGERLGEKRSLTVRKDPDQTSTWKTSDCRPLRQKQKKLHGSGFGHDFLDMTPESCVIKQISKLNFMKIPNS